MKFTEQDKQKIIELSKQGLSGAEIARRFGFVQQSVTDILNKNGIYKKTNITPAMRNEIISLRLAGKTYKEIGSIVGVSWEAVPVIWLASDEGKKAKEEQQRKEETVIAYAKQCIPHKDIAHLVGMTVNQVSYYERKAGIDFIACRKERNAKEKEEQEKQKQINFERYKQEDYEKRLNKFIFRINKYVGEYWEYDSGFVHKDHNVNLRCKRCGAVSEFYADSFGERKLKKKMIPQCPVCNDIEKTIREEEEQKEHFYNVELPLIETDYTKESLGVDYYVSPEQGEKIIELRKSGMSIHDVANTIGVYFVRVSDWCKHYDVPYYRTCDVCGKQFAVKEVRRGMSSVCSDACRKEQQRSYHRKSRHRRRARKKGFVSIDNDITLDKLAKRDSDICWLCGEKVDWNDITRFPTHAIVGPKYPSIDHVTPLSKGGSHSWDNVKLAHHSCNCVKSDNILDSEEEFDDLVLDYGRELFEPYGA